jgi:outer membrane protein OmpA-like peptidoglycan-associated protein
MRNLRPFSREEDEEESVFVPMTDMTVSFLFIVMILLAFFAVRFSDKDTVPRSVHDQLRQQYEITVVEKNKLELERNKLIAELSQAKNKIKELKLKIEELLEKVQDLEVKISKLEKKVIDLIQQLRRRDPIEAYLVAAQAQRAEILGQIEKALKLEFGENVKVEISPENDALRFKGEGLFKNDSRILAPNKRKIIEKLAELISNAVPCYTVNNENLNYASCNPEGVVIEAIQIEGHTDEIGDDAYNLDLSTGRANNAFLAMISAKPNLLSYKNIRGQPVMSVAGYGEMRPIATNETEEGRAENRRIDLRLIMYTPRNRQQVDQIQQQIKEGLRLFTEKIETKGSP